MARLLSLSFHLYYHDPKDEASFAQSHQLSHFSGTIYLSSETTDVDL